MLLVGACDGWEELLLVFPVERRLAHQHLVQQHAVRPPVNTRPVRLVVNDLRRDVVRRPAERLGGRPIPDALLAHAEVRDLDVALLVEHDVVQLEVAVDDPVWVEVHYANQDLRSVESAHS